MSGARVVPYCLPLKRPWVAAAATLSERRGALLQLTDADGRTGWGDCAPLPSAGAAAQAHTLAALAASAERGAGVDFSSFPPEVRWAWESATLDLAAQRAGLPLARYLNPAASLEIAINAALGPLDANCIARARQALEDGYAIGKIKVGVAAPDEELARLRALVAATAGLLKLRLDANRAWDAATARRFLIAIADLPIDAVEEPLAAPTPAALAALQAALPYALASDESLPRLGADALIEARAVRRFVLKPARLGGFAATRAVARQAQEAGIEVVLTSVMDSAVGVAAAAHLAAAMAPTLAHGLGTGTWLAADVAPAAAVERGTLRLPDRPGLGIHPILRKETP
jgi:o-succinylbenzoate synthase